MEFGHQSVVVLYATFGTNKYKIIFSVYITFKYDNLFVLNTILEVDFCQLQYHLFTLMVFNSYRNSIWVVWIITNSATVNDMSMLFTIFKRMLSSVQTGGPIHSLLIM